VCVCVGRIYMYISMFSTESGKVGSREKERERREIGEREGQRAVNIHA